ncbi:SET domain-containing protein SmydA-8 isoform X1 [Neodiprion pinetum]|uniref:SET domain-containing protein SmydA-8 isoform X1 n=1 Tax=Neodiprion pinetum TaxID=441929 RepID=UPI001EDEAA98|nr:SET domain-containing protein SmydA-8-like isoform X1 [Neodiprion pinetum]XP_046468216.1 SET domain-containing protein SmydA-8-like isoform X1 [Neodiprion pinetum]XP_046468217.1 SET domain-containing protein SmydA-8-like isoform X1 [Neodiprion pinetum]
MEQQVITDMLNLHLERNNLSKDGSRSWFVGGSLLGGRGLFATTDIALGELVFVDAPLVVGPRTRDKHLPLCIVCYKTGCPLFPCDKGCSLPICSSACELSVEHDAECSLLQAWKPTCGSSWSIDLLRALVPIRALLLDEQQRDLLYTLQWHSGPQHGSEIDLLKSSIKIQMNQIEEQFMRRVCAVMDTNSFETAAIVGESVTSLRGLYPMGALQNHCCTPNTRHYYDSQQRLYVIAAIPIKKNEEITMTYTDLFWDTTLRRRHLAATKHFFCTCSRCTDPLENGSLLGALRCARKECSGILVAVEPLDTSTVWECRECGLRLKNRQIISIRSALGSIVEEMIYKSPKQMLRFMKSELSVLVPATNYVAVDMKLRIISCLGRTEKFLWEDLTKDELSIKEKYCRDLLRLIETLKCGECKMKGLISYELYSTLMELNKRQFNDETNIEKSESQFQVNEESKNLLETAILILQNDLTAPKDLLSLVSGMTKK